MKHKARKHGKHVKSRSKSNEAVIAVFIVALIIGIIIGSYLSVSNGSKTLITKEKASQKTIDFINKVLQGKIEVKLINATESDCFYEMNVSIGGNKYEFYATKDGKLLFQQPIRLDEVSFNRKPENRKTNVAKSEKPNVDVFVFTYCPYGLQFEKGLLPVIDLLGDKADINVRMIGAMHGLHEEVEAKRQLCIRNEQPAAFAKYLKLFVESSEIKECQNKFYTEFGRNETKMEECVTPVINKYLKTAGADISKVNDCMANRAEDYYNQDMNLAQKNGVGGSPTLIINGAVVSVGRSPESIKEAICLAFEKPPEECNTKLSEAISSPGFGSETSSSNSDASSSCGG